MVEKKHLIIEEKDLPPGAHDHTYGEKIYHLIFDVGINFWLNSVVSAGLTYFTHHYQKPVKLLGDRRPIEFYNHVVGRIADTSVLRSIKDSKIRIETAKIMGDALTIAIGGTATMVPSIWLGAKVKEPLIRWLDRHHYGQDCEDDPRLKARHELFHNERRATLLGAFTARLGSTIVNQITARTVGHTENFVKEAGVKFNGTDKTAAELGDAFGGALDTVFAKSSQRINERLRKNGTISWSNDQLAKDPSLKDKLYDRTFRDVGKYVALDSMYTLVATLSIAPLLKLLRYVPGMTYRPRATREAIRMEKMGGPAGDNTSVAPNDDDKAQGDERAPQVKVSDIQNLSKLQAQGHGANMGANT